MEKHTPKPWKYAAAVQNNGPDYFAITDGKWGSPNIAICYSLADARLITAAPELLIALEGLLKVIDAEVKACGIYKAHREQAVKAIAKTKGDSA